MSDLVKRILMWVGGVFGVFFLIGGLGLIIYQQMQIQKKQNAIESQIVSQKELVDGIVRSQASYASKEDIEKTLKQNEINLKAIKEDLAKLRAEINTINILIAQSHEQHGNNIPTDHGPNTNPNPVDPKNPDPYGYLTTQQLLALNEDFGSIKIPIGSVGFSAWQEKPWNIDISSREYKVTTVVGTDEEHRNYVYNKFTVTTEGKEYVVPISSATTQQVFPEAKFYAWNPRLFIGADGAVGVNPSTNDFPITGEFIPSINLQIMSYGQYKDQPDWSILQVGVGFGVVSKQVQFVVTPFAYNVGKHIPFVKNTYIAPSFSVGTDGNFFIGAGLRIGL